MTKTVSRSRSRSRSPKKSIDTVDKNRERSRSPSPMNNKIDEYDDDDEELRVRHQEPWASPLRPPEVSDFEEDDEFIINKWNMKYENIKLSFLNHIWVK